MVTAKTQYNLKNARDYFEEHLCVGDYYNEGVRVAGEWIGLGTERLGLSGKVRADDFLRLCENQNPSTGETLTQRLNSTRTEGGESAANRRIFYDFTFSPPKSVSIAGFLGKDERIFDAHARAVKTALREFEAFAATRVRASGAQNDRLTGNFAAALFTHDTSRALDPHLHTHCMVFNATFDPVENRWKALQNYELLRARKFAENAYYHELARELRGFGYFTTKQAIEAGYEDNTHPYHVRAGNWERVRRGIYRMAHLPPPEDGEMMVWLLWTRGRDEKPVGAMSHQTALSLFELGDFNPAKVHITVPPTFRRNSRLPKTVVLHRAGLAPGQVTQLRGLTVCRPLRAVCDVAASDPNAIDVLRPAAMEARQRGLITEREISTLKQTESTRKLITSLFQ